MWMCSVPKQKKIQTKLIALWPLLFVPICLALQWTYDCFWKAFRFWIRIHIWPGQAGRAVAPVNTNKSFVSICFYANWVSFISFHFVSSIGHLRPNRTHTHTYINIGVSVVSLYLITIANVTKMNEHVQWQSATGRKKRESKRKLLSSPLYH